MSTATNFCELFSLFNEKLDFFGNLSLGEEIELLSS